MVAVEITTLPTGHRLLTCPQESTTLNLLLKVGRTNVFCVLFQSYFKAYHELDFSVADRNTIYWHNSVPSLGSDGGECVTCYLSILIKPTLLELVQMVNPGQPELPDWVYNGAILGVQVHFKTTF